MLPQNNISNLENIDPKQVVLLFKKNYKIFGVCLFLALGIAFVVNLYTTPMYRISSSLLIKEETQKQNANVTEYLNSSLFGANKNFQNELWVLKSSPIIEQTIKNLDLNVTYFRREGFQYTDIYDEVPFKVLLVSDHIQPAAVYLKITILDSVNFELKASSKNVSFVKMDTGETAFTKKKWTFSHEGKFDQLIETPDLALVIKRKTKESIHTEENTRYYFELTDALTLTNDMREHLKFRIIDKQATVVEVTYTCTSVKEGKDIVDEIMNVYSMQNLEQKNHSASVTINYIEQQLDEISDSLKFTEDKLQRFRSTHQLLNASDQASGMTEQYMNLQNQMAELVSKKRYYDYVDDYLQENVDISNMIVPASMGISDQLLNNLMSELIAAQAQRENLIRNNQELNPMVQKLSIKIENARKTISENISALRKTTDISIDEMNKRIQKAEATISRLPATQRQLGGIERKYRLNDAIYNYLLEKRAEAKITQASNMPNNIIIEPAKQDGPNPVSPNTSMNYLIALVLGVTVPFVSLKFIDALNTKVETQESVEKITNVPMLGKITHNQRRSNTVVAEYPKSMIAESFRALRTNIEYQYKNRHKKVILVTSCVAGEGKSFSSLNLALSYAQLGRKTLLVNFDIRKSTYYFATKETTQVGISNLYFNGNNNGASLIFHTPYDNLDFIQSGSVPPNPIELLAQDRTGAFLNHIKTIYDCIILDTSPLALVSDTYLLMDYADIILVIVRYKYSNLKVFSRIMDDLKRKHISPSGIVLNDNREYQEQYGYGYGYNSLPKKNKKMKIFWTDCLAGLKHLIRSSMTSNHQQTESVQPETDLSLQKKQTKKDLKAHQSSKENRKATTNGKQ